MAEDTYNCDIVSDKPESFSYDVNIFYALAFTLLVVFLFYLNPNMSVGFESFFYIENKPKTYPYMLSIFFLLIISICFAAAGIIWTKKKNRAKQQEQLSKLLLCFYLIFFSIICIIYQNKKK